MKPTICIDVITMKQSDVWWEVKSGFPGFGDGTSDEHEIGVEIREIDATQEEIDALHDYIKQQGGSMPMTIDEWLEMYRQGKIHTKGKSEKAYDEAMKGIM